MNNIKCELYHDNFQNFKRYNIKKAQLVIADIPYNIKRQKKKCRVSINNLISAVTIRQIIFTKTIDKYAIICYNKYTETR